MTSRMAAEIAEQPAAVAATLRDLTPRVVGLRRLVAERRLIFFARGSSDSVATYGRYLTEIAAGRPAALGVPSLATLYRTEPDLRDTVAVLVSQSGNTGELVEVAAWARRCGARTVALTNTAGSPLAATCDDALVTTAGVERAVPATKTYLTALAATAILVGAACSEAAGRMLLTALAAVPDEIAALLTATLAAPELGAASQLLADSHGLVVSSRGLCLATGAELALKFTETCRLPSLGLSSADLQHGPLAALGPTVPLVVAAPSTGPTLAGLLATLRAARTAGAPSVVLGVPDELRRSADVALPGTRLPEVVAPLAAVVPGQLLAEATARRRGLDPDAPFGLRKVTQTA